MSLTIEKCDASHLDALDAFYDRVVEHLEVTVNYPKWTRGVYPCRASVSRAIDADTQYVCLDGGQAVGAFILNDDPQGDYSAGDWRKPLRVGEFAVIHTLAVSPDASGRGVGRAMVEFCIERAKALGYKALRLDVVPGNDPAERLYERMGFQFAGRKDLKRGFDELGDFDLYELNF